jgi:hypothetical protein
LVIVHSKLPIVTTFLLALLILLQTPATGRITGHVVEARTSNPLAAVLVKIQETGQQALSDGDGRFEIADVPAGKKTLVVSVVGYGLVRRHVDVVANDAVDVTVPVAEGASAYVEDVTVGAPTFRRAEPGVASQRVLGSRDLLALRGVIADDPFRAVQVMPTVATGDDFTAEFAVRGHGPRNIGIALDGIDSPLLFHTVRSVGDTGSLALINSDILESATLLSGAYPQRAGQHVGARLDFTTREPARDRLTARALLSGTAATTVWEGPLNSGHGNGDKAAWMFAARRSYIDWLLKKIDPDIEGTFGFSDAQAKVVLNPSPRHAITLSAIGGMSLLHEQDSIPGPNALVEGRNNTVIGNIRWQFSPTAAFAITNQAYVVQGRYKNTVADGRARQQGLDSDITWRGTAQYALGAKHFIDGGLQAQFLRGERLDRSFMSRGIVVNADARRSYQQQAAWINYRWAPASKWNLQPGARVERSDALHKTVTSPWLLTEFQLAPSTRVHVNGGFFHQMPNFDQMMRPDPLIVPTGPPTPVVPEEAATFDLGIEKQIRDRWRLSVTGYYRQDDRAMRHELSEFRVDEGRANRLVGPSVPHWANALRGRARGVELTIDRRVTNGVSGWISYAYGDARMHDSKTGESFAADYDQRHTVNAYGIYRTSSKLGLSARLRYGSNFPIQGYFTQLGETYYIHNQRNTTRLPAYARLDLRADRAFTRRRSRVTVFAEVLNAFNRRNYGPSDFGLNFTTGIVNDLVEKVFPLLPSAGVLIEF